MLVENSLESLFSSEDDSSSSSSSEDFTAAATKEVGSLRAGQKTVAVCVSKMEESDFKAS